jgi:RNA polymerase sigma-70 factor (ECF subfamily)
MGRSLSAISRPIAAAPQRAASDWDTVQEARAGSQDAFETLVRKYQSRVVGLAARFVGEADAMDVAQETFIKTYHGLAGFRGDSAFGTWLYRITVNTAKNHLMTRSRRPAEQDVDIDELEEHGYGRKLSDLNTPESTVLAGEIEDELNLAISRLPQELHQAILLRELDGLSYEEIAQALQCPVGTVRSRLFRAREAVDAAVEPLLH